MTTHLPPIYKGTPYIPSAAAKPAADAKPAKPKQLPTILSQQSFSFSRMEEEIRLAELESVTKIERMVTNTEALLTKVDHIVAIARHHGVRIEFAAGEGFSSRTVTLMDIRKEIINTIRTQCRQALADFRKAKIELEQAVKEMPGNELGVLFRVQVLDIDDDYSSVKGKIGVVFGKINLYLPILNSRCEEHLKEMAIKADRAKHRSLGHKHPLKVFQ